MALPRTLTVADLYAMPESERGERYELIAGALCVNPAPTPAHQIISGNLMLNLELHVRANRLGRVIATPGVRVDELTYVVPDIVFIARPRMGIIGSANVTAAPDLACEILSHATRRYDLTAKCDLYARIGVREYWLVDPAAKSVTVLTLRVGNFVEFPAAEAGLVDSLVLPGLHLVLDDVFEGVENATPDGAIA